MDADFVMQRKLIVLIGSLGVPALPQTPSEWMNDATLHAAMGAAKRNELHTLDLQVCVCAIRSLSHFIKLSEAWN